MKNLLSRQIIFTSFASVELSPLHGVILKPFSNTPHLLLLVCISHAVSKARMAMDFLIHSQIEKYTLKCISFEYESALQQIGKSQYPELHSHHEVFHQYAF